MGHQRARPETTKAHVSGHEPAARRGLFVILGLIEVVLPVGTRFAGSTGTPPGVAPLVLPFVTLAAMYRIDFAQGAEVERHLIARSGDPAAIGRQRTGAGASGRTPRRFPPGAGRSRGGVALTRLGKIALKRLTNEHLPGIRPSGAAVPAAAVSVSGTGWPLTRSAMSVVVHLAFAILEGTVGGLDAQRAEVWIETPARAAPSCSGESPERP